MEFGFKAGDEVVSLGDPWVGAGSKGVVMVIVEGGETLKIHWKERYHPVTGQRIKEWITLFNKTKHVELANVSRKNPNLSFKILKMKEKGNGNKKNHFL